MRWPFVYRSKHNVALANCRQLHGKWLEARCQVQALEKALDIANALRREEQWRRIKAEGLCAYKDERIRRAIGLITPADEALTVRPPPADGGKP